MNPLKKCCLAFLVVIIKGIVLADPRVKFELREKLGK